MKICILVLIIICTSAILTACQSDGNMEMSSTISSSTISSSSVLASTSSSVSSSSVSSSSSSLSSLSTPSSSSSSASSSLEVQSNPETPQSSEAIEDKVTYDYEAERRKAIDLETYLWEKLSKDEHGGIFLRKGSTLGIDIWVVDTEKVERLLSEYAIKDIDVTLKLAKCTYRDMENLSSELLHIPIASNEGILPSISKQNNSITIYISSNDAKALAAKVQDVIEKQNFPQDCVNINVVPDARENPTT